MKLLDRIRGLFSPPRVPPTPRQRELMETHFAHRTRLTSIDAANLELLRRETQLMTREPKRRWDD